MKRNRAHKYYVLDAQLKLSKKYYLGVHVDNSLDQTLRLRDGKSFHDISSEGLRLRVKSYEDEHDDDDDELPPSLRRKGPVPLTDNSLLPDFVSNDSRLLIVSENAKGVLHGEGISNVEYYRAPLYDEAGQRLIASHYYIANLIGTVDCLDREKSELYMSRIAPDRVQSVDKLVLKKRNIPPEQRLFRVGTVPFIKIIRDDLVDVFKQRGLVGFELSRV